MRDVHPTHLCCRAPTLAPRGLGARSAMSNRHSRCTLTIPPGSQGELFGFIGAITDEIGTILLGDDSDAGAPKANVRPHPPSLLSCEGISPASAAEIHHLVVCIGQRNRSRSHPRWLQALTYTHSSEGVCV